MKTVTILLMLGLTMFSYSQVTSPKTLENKPGKSQKFGKKKLVKVHTLHSKSDPNVKPVKGTQKDSPKIEGTKKEGQKL